ncbi:hypothetical protein E4U42_000185 [Claviceps africana]|uniref:Uncharacterized protein n=1 Tax=Claviceps africana TaxID=83212 RepID=A0A8K0J0H3_9HYPO|nr:hypothetical protein E4U42_000185 [Claviceps africana]
MADRVELLLLRQRMHTMQALRKSILSVSLLGSDSYTDSAVSTFMSTKTIDLRIRKEREAHRAHARGQYRTVLGRMFRARGLLRAYVHQEVSKDDMVAIVNEVCSYMNTMVWTNENDDGAQKVPPGYVQAYHKDVDEASVVTWM